MDKETLKKIFYGKQEKLDKKGKTVAGFKDVSFEQFKDWFNLHDFEKGCHYCGTRNDRSFELYQMRRNNLRLDATRGGKRGRRLEIDRKNPFEPYDNLNNIVWGCYWCNNAKSNFFTGEEFKPIAKAIGEDLKTI